MKPYASYKPSGVPWLGAIPSDWRVEKLKFFAKFVGGGTPSKDEPMYWGGDIPWVSPKDMKQALIRDTEDSITSEGLRSSPCTLIPPNSVLTVVRSGILQHTIPVAINTVPVTLNQDMRALIPDRRVDSRYLAYQIEGCQKELREEWVKQGATVESIEHQRMIDSRLAVPSPDEQQSIADYLDAETTRIDTLIHEKDELIGLLREARTGRISELISGGGLPGSSTGDPWAPRLPDGWTLKRLKHLAQVRSGLAKGKDTGGNPTVELPYLRVANVQEGSLDLREISTMPVELGAVERFSLVEGDVLMNEGGDYDKVGRGAVWTAEISPCLHQNHVFAVRPIERELSEWLAAITQTQYAKFYFMNNAKQSTNLASISQTTVKELPILLPPKEQRDALLKTLGAELIAFDDLIAHTHDELTLLKELRAATIADAVLGRIDVRTSPKS
ncbi:restriction endonuclease subunit S [Acidovorax temperans]|uniref:restriction endonuclease subunit S n=1 Tax=Acidovorax temperans TaxID=80878 RepID=UPI00289B1AB7|nr:restriction endonuclease subunit S [Acidovorax temperans]